MSGRKALSAPLVSERKALLAPPVLERRALLVLLEGMGRLEGVEGLTGSALIRRVYRELTGRVRCLMTIPGLIAPFEWVLLGWDPPPLPIPSLVRLRWSRIRSGKSSR